MSEYTELLRRNRGFRNLWLGSVVSQLGDWFNLLASAALIANLTSAGTAVSYLFLARFLPLFLFSPLAGVLADRYERRQVMIASDLLRAATVLGLLLVRDPADIWLLYVLTILQFSLSAIFTPARTAVLANVVRQDQLVPANALDSLTWSAMLAFGALLGGVIAAVFGIATAFVLDALTFLLSAWLISRIPGPIRVTTEAGQGGGWLGFVDGLRYLRGQQFILTISLVKAAGALAWGAINVLEVAYAETIFPLEAPRLAEALPGLDGGTASLGIIYAVAGLGTGLGPLVLRRWLGDAPRQQRRAISIGFVMMTVGIWLLAEASNLGAYTTGTLIRTIGTGAVWVFSAALLQMIVPDRYRGRVFAFEFAALTLTQSLSTYWAGAAQDALGLDVRMVARSMALVGLVVTALWLGFQMRYREDAGPAAKPRGARATQ
jgi:MFS family permease